ncbi:hypothetical protein niasHS_009917 [Heterodera schachtii]|uniref:Nuclear receptor domain-containing protein n=1 Tax=Heterodera schachtii TaxID=97005 RepID=A0ABD2JCX0_HETSC
MFRLMEKMAKQNNCSTTVSLASAAQRELDFIKRVLLSPQRGNLTAIEYFLAQNFSKHSSMMPNYGTEWKNAKVPKIEMEKHINGIGGGDEAKLDNESETDQSDQKLNKKGVGRPKRNPSECKVCGRKSLYCYYSVRCCESCKQFFRRVVAKQIHFSCFEKKNCKIGKDGIRCRGCRLDKCLLVGMDPKMISLKQKEGLAQFLEILEMRKLSLLLSKELHGRDE